jgi:hypothetical protein
MKVRQRLDEVWVVDLDGRALGQMDEHLDGGEYLDSSILLLHHESYLLKP